ncbi:hypothetical protein RJ641_029041 [Dillenia turbinata]|uniref:E3 ubiquitin-protein ligase RMA n=1 Tax=Dillenia turbinata TaxID=194707 RepID=A0AAN8ZMJ7_9MAGN
MLNDASKILPFACILNSWFSPHVGFWDIVIQGSHRGFSDRIYVVDYESDILNLFMVYPYQTSEDVIVFSNLYAHDVYVVQALTLFDKLEMASEFGESTSSRPSENSSCTRNDGGDAGDFECNICFDLAQDPIVTLCGHLFCWPCLYRWLHFHSHSSECPVCKAVVQEEKLVPLYGRGKTTTDPRTKPIPGINIPNRPAGQRPETAPSPGTNSFFQHGFGLMGGFAPTASARFGNFTFSAAFGGLIPPLFNFHFHGFPDARMYGATTTTGFPYGFHNSYHGGHFHGYPRHMNQRQQSDYYLKMLLLMIGVFVILALIWQ